MGSTPAGRSCLSKERHPERSEAQSKDLVELPLDPAAGFLDFARNDTSTERLDPAEQIFFARHAGDLIAELTVLEKEQRGDRTDVVLE